MTWQGKKKREKGKSIDIRCEDEKEELVITGPAGSGACVVVWTIAVEVAEMTVAVVRPVPWSRCGSQILCVVHVGAQTFRTAGNIKVGLIGEV